MVAADRLSSRPLNEQLLTQYRRFNVYQLVRLLTWPERSNESNAVREASSLALRAGVRFRADLSATFPGHEVSRLAIRPASKLGAENAVSVNATMQSSQRQLELTTANYCIAGSLGPLPEPFTEWIRDQERRGERVSAEFLNLFNNRVHRLRHQLQRQQHLALGNTHPEDAAPAHYLAAIAGLDLAGDPGALTLPRRAWLSLAGLLADRRKSAATALQILRRFLGVPVKLVPLIGDWKSIESADRLLLGAQGHRLGRQTVLGGRVWDQQAGVRLEVSPLAYESFCQLLPLNALASIPPVGHGRAGDQVNQDDHQAQSHPNEQIALNIQSTGALTAQAVPTQNRGSASRQLADLLHLLLDRRCDCEVELAVLSETVPESRLCAEPVSQLSNRPADQFNVPTSAVGLRLGYTAWLATRLSTPEERESGPKVRTVRYRVPAFNESVPA